MAPSILLRPALPGDEPFLFEMFALTRIELFRASGYEVGHLDEFLRSQYDAQARAYRERFPGNGYRVVLDDGRPIGRYFVDRSGAEFRIVDIALLPEYRGRGIGGALIGSLLEEAARASLPVRIHVERLNRAAGLYERLGFRTVGDYGPYFEMEWSPGDLPR